MDITAKMEITVSQQQFVPPACFFAAAAQNIQLSPIESQCSGKSASKQVKRQRSSSPELLRCKRRLNFAGFGYSLPQQQPHAVARRNERERNRVKLVNNGFATLREHVPNGAANKKMSKVETLRSAVEYIRALQQLLDEHDAKSRSYWTSPTGFELMPRNMICVFNQFSAPTRHYRKQRSSCGVPETEFKQMKHCFCTPVSALELKAPKTPHFPRVKRFWIVERTILVPDTDDSVGI
ncbi:hypothetical protein SKAU_G00027280 [Synaphobranchus kaupii]|uniref:BHLH domain-containing protein n=1 Tax=Synaphobranchus kaupii TaxID=118154 RepID=A0A9Q1GD28_SYNKA|nr:hypothetical protein SKAU_G00027280 [Synaphobranchus kaupii]